MAEPVRIEECEATAETDKALLVSIDGDEPIWVPKSVIDDESEVYSKGHEGTLVVAEWFARKNGLT